MKILIVGATGFIGKSLVGQWLSKGCDVLAVGRSKDKINDCFHGKVEAATCDDLEKGALDGENVECVVNLAGAGIADKRWTTKRKKEILESRIYATQKIVSYCLRNKIPLLNASAIGIYGSQDIVKDGLPESLDEDSDFSGNDQGFLSEVAQKWEAATATLKKAGIRVVNLRFGVVLGKDGGALKKIALPFYFFVGGPLGSGQQAFSWISINDVCRAIDFLISNETVSGPVNLVSPQCIAQRDFVGALGKVLRCPSIISTPGVVLKIILGQMADEMLLNGQHVYPKKLLEDGFEFKDAMIIDALKDIYKS